MEKDNYREDSRFFFLPHARSPCISLFVWWFVLSFDWSLHSLRGCICVCFPSFISFKKAMNHALQPGGGAMSDDDASSPEDDEDEVVFAHDRQGSAGDLRSLENSHLRDVSTMPHSGVLY